MQNLLFHGLQHEIRTLLTTILTVIAYLKNEPLSHTQQNYVNVILHTAKQLLNFANTLKPQPHDDIPHVPLRKLKVLLVEDHLLIRQIHQTMLLNFNCKTTVASNTKEALELAIHHYDLIILDIGFPNISGIELAKILKNKTIYSNTSLLVLTAFKDPNTKQFCLAAGVAEVLHKPINFNTPATVLSSQPSTKRGSK